MDATGWSVIIGAISLGICNYATVYWQNKRLDVLKDNQAVNLQKIDETKAVLNSTKIDVKAALTNQKENSDKLTEIHEQTNGRLGGLEKRLEEALAEVKNLTLVAASKEKDRVELADVVERDKVRAVASQVEQIK